MSIRVLILLLPILSAACATGTPSRFDDLIGLPRADILKRYGSPDAETWINDRQVLTYIMDEHRLPSATPRSPSPRLHHCRVRMEFDRTNTLRSIRESGNCHSD
ncbi:hypothetical protein V6B08_15675 [Ferrovibrio sp. MS7]|uniref:hypothetical protein n=1 Tax=Ferrovibrio TaxID=1231242 RepID=UPI0031351B46